MKRVNRQIWKIIIIIPIIWKEIYRLTVEYTLSMHTGNGLRLKKFHYASANPGNLFNLVD